MDNYFILWRLLNSEGKILTNPQYGYELGLDMRYSQGRVHFISNEEIKSRHLRLVSTVVMTMIAIPGSEGLLQFIGKPRALPADDSVEWSPLRWKEDHSEGEMAHHILMRFGDRDNQDERRVRMPDQNCPSVMKYLFHRTELIRPSDPYTHRDHDHGCCTFKAPIGIFWGMVGLRSLDHWGVVRGLIGDGDWLRTSEDPAFDPTPYQPLHAVTPNVYLQVRIVVPLEQPEFQRNYFKYKTHGEIDIPWAEGSSEDEEGYGDDDHDDHDDHDDNNFGRRIDRAGGTMANTHEEYADDQTRMAMYQPRGRIRQDAHEEYADDQTQMVIHQPRGGRTREDAHGEYAGDQMQMVTYQSRAGANLSPRQHRPPKSRKHQVHEGSTFTGSHYEEMMSQSYDEGFPQRYTESSKPPSIPEELRLEDLYISRKKLRQRDLTLYQSSEERAHMLSTGTGLSLENELSSLVEDVRPRKERRRRKHPPINQYYDDSHGYEEDDNMEDSPGELDQYSDDMSSGNQAQYSRREPPVSSDSDYRRRLRDVPRITHYDAAEDQIISDRDLYYRSHHEGHYSDDREDDGNDDHYSRHGYHYRSPSSQRERGYYPPEEADNIRQWNENYHGSPPGHDAMNTDDEASFQQERYHRQHY
ncbi:hypothetical protein TWF730_003861 [Orbilia blumenaviensis]|uniref:Uncharacterized protein n=1 Tax=Orbilia blumenaviensis TaxID=1796055 RepID=A0AAV9U4Z5_9PEZI